MDENSGCIVYSLDGSPSIHPPTPNSDMRSLNFLCREVWADSFEASIMIFKCYIPVHLSNFHI